MKNMIMELNVFNLQNQLMGFDDVKHHTLNWVGDSSLGGVQFDDEEVLISCVYESFCLGYEPESNTLHLRNIVMIDCMYHSCIPLFYPFLQLMRHLLVCLHPTLLN